MTADRRTDRRARHRAGGREEGAGRAAGPVSHRRRPAFRGRRPLLATLLSAFLLVGVCAATGIAWDPSDVASVQGAAAPGDLPVTNGTGGSPGASGEATPSPVAPPAPTKGAAAKGNPENAVDSGAERPTGALPFDMPAPAALRSGGAGKKLVFAHYFTPYPLSLDNAAADRDYYTRNYLNPDGESGKHGRYGGLLRDRPLPVTPKGGDWEYANLQQEVRTARAAGIDGFTLDLLSLSGKNWDRSNLLMAAARSVDPAFKIMLMPDMTSLKTDDPRVLAEAIATLADASAAHRLPDGRLVVSPSRRRRRASPGGPRSSPS